ncbi:MAG: hypothetical protein N4A32_00990 [Marinifilaceae bacterium]|jgi:hypothetical protein|nr:hypothetical protein [Marinifilaceae bacterium]
MSSIESISGNIFLTKNYLIKVIEYIDCNLNLIRSNINFKDLVDESVSSCISIENENLDEYDVRYREECFNAINNRFKKDYELDIFSIEDGYTKLSIQDGEIEKKNLHKFLVYHSFNGGENAKSNGAGSLFERISANSVKNFLGKNSKYILVGEDGRNLNKEALEDYAKELSEKFGHCNNLPTKAQDDGVDFIVYKPIDRRNVGNIIVLGQACVGKNFKRKKQIHKRWLNEYINFAITPLCLLSTVQYLENDDLRNIHSEFGSAIIFDRLRIIKYYNIEDESLNEDICNFVENFININE